MSGESKYRMIITCETRFVKTVADAVKDLNADDVSDFAVTYSNPESRIELTTAQPERVQRMNIISLAAARIRVTKLT